MKSIFVIVCLTAMAIIEPSAAPQTTAITGTKIVAAIAEPARDLRIVGKMFVAGSINRIGMVLVVVRWGNGPDFYSNEDV